MHSIDKSKIRQNFQVTLAKFSLKTWPEWLDQLLYRLETWVIFPRACRYLDMLRWDNLVKRDSEIQGYQTKILE
jgi:hypothetical protein